MSQEPSQDPCTAPGNDTQHKELEIQNQIAGQMDSNIQTQEKEGSVEADLEKWELGGAEADVGKKVTEKQTVESEDEEQVGEEDEDEADEFEMLDMLCDGVEAEQRAEQRQKLL